MSCRYGTTQDAAVLLALGPRTWQAPLGRGIAATADPRQSPDLTAAAHGRLRARSEPARARVVSGAV